MPGWQPDGCAYPSWFRHRVVATPGSARTVATQAGVHVSTVYRFRARCHLTGRVERSRARGGRPFRTTPAQDEAIRTLTLLRPDARASELRAVLAGLGAVPLSASTFSRRWKSMGFTRKRLRIFARQRDENRRVSFWLSGPELPIGVSGVAGVPPLSLIDIDECGVVLNEVERRVGLAPRGKRAYLPGRVRQIFVMLSVRS